MRLLLLFLTIASGTIYGQSPANSPLTPDEGRVILGQLQDLQVSRSAIKSLEDAIARDAEQDARAAATSARELTIAERETDLERERTALALEKATMWEQLYRSVTKKPGLGCRILRAVTLGIHRCN